MKKLTHEEFLSKFNETFKDKNYILPNGYKYNSLKDNLLMTCGKCSHTWNTTPNRLINRKNGCPNCYKNSKFKTHEQFVKDFKTKFPDKNYIFLTEYTGIDKYIEIQCLDCGHIWKNIPDRLLHQSNGCSNCSGGVKRTHQNFINNFKMRCTNKNIEFLSEYQGVHKTITWKCLDCNNIQTTFVNTLYQDNSCSKCSNIKRTKTHEQFLDEFQTKFPDKKYIFLTKYINSLTKIKIQCDKNSNHIWEATPSSLFGMKSGCPYCANNIKYSHEQFIKNLQERFPQRNLKFFDNYTGNKNKIKVQCDKNPEHIWEATPQNLYHKGSSCPYCSIQRSKAEEELIYLFNNTFIERDKSFDIEIDLLSKNYNFGVEYNGILFHSFGVTYPNNIDKFDKNKHLRKTQILENKGYQLFHVCESDWLDPKKKDIWVSMISNKLGKSNRIFARKLKIVDLTTYKDFVNNFLEDNHLQGKYPYAYAYGLQNPRTGEVYSIMTFGHSRYDKRIEYELIRFCSYKNYSIIGGASKILKHFEKTIKPKSLISYANRDWSQGNVYKQLGFEFIENTQPNYWYYDSHNLTKKYSRQHFMKHKLKGKLDFFDENLTELENMLNNDYRIYYDTGNMKFIKNYH